jgi:hypothetical protein
MGLLRVLRCLVIVAELLIECNVCGNDGLLETMFRAVFPHPDLAVFEHDLGAELPVTIMTEADRMIVIDIITGIRHSWYVVRVLS